MSSSQPPTTQNPGYNLSDFTGVITLRTVMATVAFREREENTEVIQIEVPLLKWMGHPLN